MKVRLKTIFSISVFAAAPFPMSISFGGLNGAYFYELIVIACFFLLIFNGGVVREVRSTIRSAGLFDIFRVGGVFIFFSLFGVGYSFFETAFSNLGYESTQLKMIAHVLISLLLLSGALVCGFTLFNGTQDLKYVSYLVVIAIFSMSLLVLYEWITVTGMSFSRYNFDPPTGLGQGDTAKMLLLGVTVSCSLLHTEKLFINRVVLTLVLITLSIACLTIQSRASYFLFFFMAFMMGFLSLQNLNGHRRRLATLGLSLSSLVLLGMMAQYISSSFIVVSSVSIASDSQNLEQLNKLVVIGEAMGMFFENIFLGIGMGMFGLFTKAEMTFASGAAAVTVASPHNGVAQLLAEGGVVGFSLFSILLFKVFSSLHRIFKLKFSSEVYFHNRILLLFLYSVLGLSIFFGSHLLPPLTQRDAMRIAFYLWFLIGFSLSFLKREPSYK
mgnify:CR=1 FL=1